MNKDEFDNNLFKSEFDKAKINKLEEEFQILKNSSYVKIYDENLEGKDRFMGLLTDDCLYEDQ